LIESFIEKFFWSRKNLVKNHWGQKKVVEKVLSAYRYGFNGQEKDDEVEGQGNSYTAEYWQYSSRLGRRWNIDPIVKISESPYATFNNNPIYFVDVSGADGIATVNKKDKTINVKAVFYYNKNDKNLSRKAITGDVYVKQWEETIKSEISLIKKGEFSNIYTFKDDSGDEWTVTFELEFVGLDGEQAVDEKLKNDKTANRLIYDEKLNVAGKWINKSRTLAIGFKRRRFSTFLAGGGLNNVSTTEHEIGHAMGMPHAYDNPDSPFFGLDNKKSKNYNGEASNNGGLMSYAKKRKLQNYEVKLMLSDAIKIAKEQKSNVVKIHLSGFVNKHNLNKHYGHKYNEKQIQSIKKRYGDKLIK